jgi:hypothetical protein
MRGTVKLRSTLSVALCLLPWTTRAGEETPAAPKKLPVVKLLAEGKDPKFPLRYKPAKGSREEMIMTIGTKMSMSVNGVELPSQKLPGQKLVAALKVLEVTKEGDIHQQVVFDKVELTDTQDVPEPLLEMLGETLKGIAGMKGSAVVTDRGITKTAEIAAGKDASPLMLQTIDNLSRSLESFASPVPEEAVGTGARWEVTQETELNGVRLRQKATYELVLITGTLRRLRFEVKQEADEQEIQPPGVPAKMRLKGLTGSGKGEMLVDLTQLSPRKSTFDLSTEFELSSEELGIEGMKQEIKMTMGIEGKKVDG